ncbi:MAG: hypothetical protein ACM3H9_06965 [Rhodospirillaceae bacterium]
MLSGTGTAGAYHAGVLRALAEAGVRVDIVAGHGAGAIGAVFTAIEGGPALWGQDGCWRQKAVAGFYGWRPALRALGWASAAALALVLVPLAFLAGGLVAYPASLILSLAGLDAGRSLADNYAEVVHGAFAPGGLASWVPRASLLLAALVLAAVGIAASRARMAGRKRERGRFWWRVFGAPIDSAAVVSYWQTALWRLITGGARAPRPGAADLSRRYAELLTENLGQPGFRELLLLVHDLDTRRDLVVAALTEPYRRSFFGRRAAGAVAVPERAGETLDLTGSARGHVTDALAAALCLPVVTEPWPVTFSAESYWRGETHRWCDRPGGVARLLEEVQAAGAEQVIVVSSSTADRDPHTLTDLRLDGRGRIGTWLASEGAASVRDAARAAAPGFRCLLTVCPAYNPLGPLDMIGTYDERSDRVQLLAEALDQGYADAYRQFIEPVVGAADLPSYPTP